MLVGSNVIPVGILDVSDIAELPPESRDDLVKAAQRLRDGDLSGALSAACGAVDVATAKVYADAGLGDSSKASFQEACSVALEKKKVIANLEEQLKALNWAEDDIKKLSGNFKSALNQGANVMQALRSKMGDVHGTKPVLKPLVFDSIKWAEIMLRSLV